MFKIDFKNKRVDFARLATFAKKNNLNHKECLMQAFNQNVLIEDNVDLLKNFINSFENIDQINSQLYQDVFASFIIGEKFIFSSKRRAELHFFDEFGRERRFSRFLHRFWYDVQLKMNAFF